MMKNLNENLRKNMMRVQKMIVIGFVFAGFDASLQAGDSWKAGECCARKSPEWAAYVTEAERESDKVFEIRAKAEKAPCGISMVRSVPLGKGVKKPQPTKGGKGLPAALARLDIKK